MKHSKFVNLSHKYLVDLFSKKDEQVGSFQEFKAYNRIGLSKADYTAQTRLDIDDLNKKRDLILEFLDDNKEVFNQLDQLVTDYEQHKVLLNPTIHVARTKDTNNPDIEYFKAKTFFPYPNGVRKEVKVHLGRSENYGNKTTSVKAKEEALRKMRQTLARRIREGSL